MHSAVSPWGAREAAFRTGTALPILRWDGRSPTMLIAEFEARIASGARFVVLAPTGPLGRHADQAFLDNWWRAAQPRLAGLCVGWAIIVRGADVDPRKLASAQAADFEHFPLRACADQADALWWVRTRLAKLDPAPATPIIQ